ncbi:MULTISPECIES: MFS transporter [Paraburkholderia]|uniref:MFS transporter n=1 Tax=Paraburkholderia metrosideri TaxID=580937 RepID=A0ABW9E1X8_9BURK
MQPAIPHSSTSVAQTRVTAKVFRRVIPFLVICLVFHTLDRINLGFAALAMNKDLGLDPAVFGLAAGIGGISYIIAEIPSNIAMSRFGARVWLSRIMITWGIAAAATALVVGPRSFFLVRFLLGLAEAGFLPGVFLYLTYWIPESSRARATSIFLLAQPVTFVLGGAISGQMLGMTGIAGLAGWKWLYILQGLPAVALGIVGLFFLTDKPEKARWLSSSEKSELAAILGHHTDYVERGQWRLLPKVLRNPAVLLLGLAYFGLPSSLSSYAAWAPLIVQDVLPKAGFLRLGEILALPPLVCVVVMSLWGKSSDRSGERVWHTVLPVLVAAAGWLLIAFSNTPVVRLLGLTAAITGSFAAQAIFWTIATLAFPPHTRPVGIATVSTIGLLGGAVSPFVVGVANHAAGNFKGGLIWIASLLFVTAVCVLAASRRNTPRDEFPQKTQKASDRIV